MMQNPKYAFFGTPYVARDTLNIIASHGYVPAVVVSSPDARSGRGMALSPSKTKVWAQERGIPVLTPEKIDAGAIAAISAYGCEYAIAVAYGKILPQELIRAFPKGVLNIHYSLLPLYRGASPVESALLKGDAVTGVSIQKMVPELDAGDILAQKEVAIEPTETTRELRARLIEIGANLLADVLPSFISGAAPFTPQDGKRATWAKKIEKTEGLLVLSGNSHENWNKYRAYAESPGTYFYTERNGKKMRVKIIKAAYENGQFMPLRVIPEGKREMDYADFLRGV